MVSLTFLHPAARCSQPGAASGYTIPPHKQVCMRLAWSKTHDVSECMQGSRRTGAPSSSRVAEARALKSTREGALGASMLYGQTHMKRNTLDQVQTQAHMQCCMLESNSAGRRTQQHMLFRWPLLTAKLSLMGFTSMSAHLQP